MNEVHEKKRLRIFASALAAAAAFLFLSAWFLEVSTENKSDLNEAARTAEINLDKIETAAIEFSDHALSLIEKSELLKYFAERNLSSHGITILIYDDAELTAWSGSDATFASMEKLLNHSSRLVHLPNGWYEMLVRERNNRSAVIFILIYADYAYQNKYLVNEFNTELEIPEGIEIAPSDAGVAVQSKDGQNLFRIKSSENYLPAAEKFPLPELLDMLALIAVLGCFFTVGSLIMFYSAPAAVIFILFFIALRVAMVNFRIPEALYETALFSPSYYASSFFFGSLGDLLLNTSLAVSTVLIFYYHLRADKNFFSLAVSRGKSILYHSLAVALLISASVAVNFYASGLILNSKISFSPRNIFELNGFSALGFVIIFMLMGFYFLILKVTALFIRNSPLAAGFKTRCLIFSAGITFLALLVRFGDAGATEFFTVVDFIVLLVLAVTAELFFIREKLTRFQSSVFLILIFSCYASMLVLTFEKRKEEENLKLMVRKMENAQDPVAEHLYEDIQSRINNDTVIHRLASTSMADLVAQRLQQIYFSGYWARFDAQIFCFDTSGNLLSFSHDSLPLSYFEKIISASGTRTLNKNLFFTGNAKEPFSYIARVLPGNNDPSPIHIYILLTEKFLPEETGLPELFVSGNILPGRKAENYSFARYNNDKLISGLGAYSYPLSSSAFGTPVSGYSSLHEKDYEHLVFCSAPGSMVVLTRPHRTRLEMLTLFSFITILFTLLLVLIAAASQLLRHESKFESSLKQRIRIAIMMLVAASFILTAWGTIRFIAQKYDKELDENISDKINHVLRAMNAELPRQHMFEDILSDEKTTLLLRLSSVLSADFNIYDLSGRLIFSSQPKLYQQGIISDRMNPEALFELSVKGKTSFAHSENIGRLNYIAAYRPVSNRDNETEGYIGLPYFGKQEELKKEISSFIGSLMNLYILLLALALTVAYFISSRITLPLQQLREKFSVIRLDRHSEKIQWQRKDEIGALVNEYNRMIDELAMSAEMLAQSERETAWREMAKQVAHEIKNPLTPMKLSIQHLQRALKDNSPETKTLAEKTSRTLIEQIDSLSSIATAFSSFARMPQGIKGQINVTDLIHSVLNLYKDSSHVKFIFPEHETDPCLVSSDKEELMRMFGNIIKNAIQSIPENKEGRIEIKIQREVNRCLVSVADNGRGIPDEIKSKIFSPNFTTKNTGMGLGLALARSIAESTGGHVWFETKIGAGTTFFVELPLSSQSS